jgi:hypothetical protein
MTRSGATQQEKNKWRTQKNAKFKNLADSSTFSTEIFAYLASVILAPYT